MPRYGSGTADLPTYPGASCRGGQWRGGLQVLIPSPPLPFSHASEHVWRVRNPRRRLRDPQRREEARHLGGEGRVEDALPDEVAEEREGGVRVLRRCVRGVNHAAEALQLREGPLCSGRAAAAEAPST